MNYIDIGEQHKLLLDFSDYLKTTMRLKLEEFLQGKITFYEFPSKQLFNIWGLNIGDNWKRSVYITDINKAILVPKIKIDEECSLVLGIQIEKESFTTRNNVLEQLSKAIAYTLSEAFRKGCRYSLPLVGDNLIKLFMSYYLAKGNYNWSLIYHAIDYFISLRTTSFEGSNFSTGMILSKSGHDYAKGISIKRPGNLFALSRSFKESLLSNKIDRRIWYLVDGFHSYYLTDQYLKLRDVYITHNINENSIYSDYVKSYTMFDTLMGSDILFRIESAKELSIITSESIIFRYHENHWMYRDLNSIANLINKYSGMDENTIKHLTYCIMTCSKNNISSIICIPKSNDEIEHSPILLNKQRQTSTIININDENYVPLVMRYLSSDGATIIDTKGNILYQGCFVNLNKNDQKGLHGTGETAANLLSQLGTVFKISQDGTIKMFMNEKENCIML